ncbi:MAG: hypothetical protein NC548_39715 [Lachnospiraceae bacterium]|nr:hypothetical protein [Lachnospiraceae bacterium]
MKNKSNRQESRALRREQPAPDQHRTRREAVRRYLEYMQRLEDIRRL